MNKPAKRKRLLFSHDRSYEETVDDSRETEPLSSQPTEYTKERYSKWVDEFDATTDGRYICRACKKSFGAHSSNLGRHLAQKHPAVYALITKAESASKEAYLKQQQELKLISATSNKLLKNLIISVACHNTAFREMDINPIYCENMRELVSNSGVAWTVNAVNIKKLTQFAANQLKSVLTSKFSNRQVHLQFDLASRQARKFLGVSLSYYDNGEVKYHALGVIERRESNTGENVANCIEEVS